MKINLKVEVPNPKEVNRAQKDLVTQIQKIVNDRVNSSRFAQTYSGQIYLSIFIKKQQITDKVTEIAPGLFFGYDSMMTNDSNYIAFMSIMRNGLKVNLSIPNSEKNVIVFFSDKGFTFEDLCPSDNNVQKQYLAKDPDYSLKDVVMTDKERRAVMRAITLIRDKDLIYKKWNFSHVDKRVKSILCFHGVPGTGKTMCAHGVASYLGKKIIEGSYAEIESEFVGVGAKNLAALFRCAQEEDAVLFIDEADTFLSRRLPASNDSSKHYNSMSNQLYTLIENFNGCIVFASNHIKDFDPAVISRIIEPIEFNLPDFEGRKSIWDHMLQKEMPLIQDSRENTLNLLSKATEGFSGRDIRKVLQISHAAIVWKYKYELGVNDDDILATIDDILACIEEVKDANERIKPQSSRKGNLLSSFTDQDKRHNRVIQLAAHTLLADGKVDEREAALFKELESSLRVTCRLQKDSLPSVESICSNIDTNAEELELLEIICRMTAVDGKVHESELALLKQVCDLFCLNESIYNSLVEYTYSLAKDYVTWASISASLGISDSEILSTLKKEYSEGASYFRLSQYYREGTSLFGGIEPSLAKASKYEEIAVQLGYVKKQ